MLRTNIELDERLIKEAMRFSDYRTKKEIVNCALSEFVRKLKRRNILKLMGSNCWAGNLNEMRKGRF